MTIQIEPETPSHHAAIRSLITAAFSAAAEAELVDRLRSDGDLVLSLVAAADNAVAGHVALSRMAAPFRALGLGPLAVDRRHRGQGLARSLVEHAVAWADAQGWEGIFVLGDPAFYRRFGFSAEDAAGYSSPYAGPYLMLRSNGPIPRAGAIHYAPAFSHLA